MQDFFQKNILGNFVIDNNLTFISSYNQRYKSKE